MCNQNAVLIGLINTVNWLVSSSECQPLDEVNVKWCVPHVSVTICETL